MAVSKPALLAALLTATVMAGCTNDDFAASGSQKAARNASKDDPNSTEKEYDSNTSKNPTGTDTTSGDENMALSGTQLDRFNGEEVIATSPVDIVFAMDTSGSMSPEKGYLQQHMASFVQKFLEEAKNIDFQIYMIGSNFQFPNADNTKILHINQYVSSTNALAILTNYFSGKISGAPMVRAESKKHIVVISDDDARTVLATDFKAFVQATEILKGKTSFNAFVGLPTSAQNSWCQLSRPGAEYSKLGSDPEVGGLIQDLCVTDWSNLLGNLAEKIISFEKKTRFTLSKPAKVSSSIEVRVNGVLIDLTDYTFDAIANSIVFQQGKEPGDQANVEVTYSIN